MFTVETLPVGLFRKERPEDLDPDRDSVLSHYSNFDSGVRIEPGWSSWQNVCPGSREYEQGLKIFLIEDMSDLFAPIGGYLRFIPVSHETPASLWLISPSQGVSIIYENVDGASVEEAIRPLVRRMHNRGTTRRIGEDEVNGIITDFMSPPDTTEASLSGLPISLVGVPIGKANDAPLDSSLPKLVRVKVRRGVEGSFINPFLVFNAEFTDRHPWYLEHHPLRLIRIIVESNFQVDRGGHSNPGNFDLLLYPLQYPFEATQDIYFNLEVRMTIHLDTEPVSGLDDLEAKVDEFKRGFSEKILELWDKYRLVATQKIINIFFRIYMTRAGVEHQGRRHWWIRLQPRGGGRRPGARFNEPTGLTDFEGGRRFGNIGRELTVYVELEHHNYGKLYTPMHEFGHMLGNDHDVARLDYWGELRDVPVDTLMRDGYVPGNSVTAEGIDLIPRIYPDLHLDHIREWIGSNENIHDILRSGTYIFEERP